MSEHPGIGVMIHALGGGSPRNASDFYGRSILTAEIDDNELKLQFTDGSSARIWDDGQSCCEHRYMTTDDDLKSLVGHKLIRVEAKSGPNESADYDEHETCFVEIATDAGFVTITNHNEHNGYYGGFGLSMDGTDPEPTGNQ